MSGLSESESGVEELEIVELTEAHKSAYEEFTSRCPSALVYYTWAFRSFLGELLERESRYLGALDFSGVLRGILPMMEAQGPYGIVVNSLPFFGSYGGVLAETDAARRALLERYDEIADQSSVAAMTTIENPFLGSACAPRYDCRDQRIAQVTRLDFEEDVRESLLKRIHPAARRNLRRALSSGVEVIVDNSKLGHLAAIHQENMRAIGGREKPVKFFELLSKYFEPDRDFKLFIAERQGDVAAALLVLYAGDTAEYYIPGTRLEERINQPSALMIYEAMVDACERGYRNWNWGGTWLDQEGVLRFKRKWAAADTIYHYYTRVRNEDLYYADSDDLLAQYPHFYVLPFDELRTDG